MMSSLGVEMVTLDTGKPKVEAPKYLRVIRFGGLAIKNVSVQRSAIAGKHEQAMGLATH